MGVFDFFGSGTDEQKKELEENIEQIRQRVQEEELDSEPSTGQNTQLQPPEPEPGADGGPDQPDRPAPPERLNRQEPDRPQQPQGQQAGQQPPAPQEDAPQQQQPGQPNQPAGDRPQAPPASADGGRDVTGAAVEQSAQDTARPQQRQAGNAPQQPRRSDAGQEQDAGPDLRNRPSSAIPTQPEDMGEEEASAEPAEQEAGQQTERQDADADLSETEIPEPPEIKELDIPDIERGPLFITVNKFKQALVTLSEMQEIAEDMAANVGSLENTLEEDRQTEKSLRDLLDATVGHTEVVEEIVSPNPDGGDE